MYQNEGYMLTDHFLIEESTLNIPFAKMHYHNSYELYYVVSGERDYFVGDKFFKAHNNDVVLVPSGVQHRTAGKGATRILIYFTEELLLRHFSQTVVNELLAEYKPTVLSPSGEENEKLKLLFKKMREDYEKLGSDRSLEKIDGTALPLHIFELLYIVKYGSFTVPAQESSDTRINEIIKYINENYYSIESIDDVASHFYISKYYLCRIFKKTLGISLISYLNMIRIRQAATMLRNTNERITAISTKCGFNSTSYFCKIFKDETGLSPKDYKRSQAHKK